MSAHGTSTTCSSGSPRWWSRTALRSGSSPEASSAASFTSPSTARLWHCATRSGPRSPAASTAKAVASTSRTPASTGSIPRRAQARSRNDSAGTTSTETRGSSRNNATVRSATSGEPGTA